MPPADPTLVTVDRIEAGRAVLTDERHQVEIPAAWLPAGAIEGSALRLTLDPDAQTVVAARIDSAQSRQRRGEDVDLE